MEGGQKNKINLEAGLDINTSDMLVPFAAPTFQHNWQKWQGKCLPNSLRYEQNGWAVGWDVIEFDYSSTRIQVGDYWAGATLLNRNPTYNLNLYMSENDANSIATFTFTPTSRIISVIDGTATLAGNSITGTVGSQNFTINWDPTTETLSCNSPNVDMSYVQNGDKTYTITMRDMTVTINVNNIVYTPDSLSSPSLSNAIAYDGFKNGKHTWGDITYDEGTGLIAGVTPTITEDNKLSFSYEDVDENILKGTFTLDNWILSFKNLALVANSTKPDKKLLCEAATEKASINFWSSNVSPSQIKGRDLENPAIIDLKVPLHLSANIGTTVNYSAGAKEADNVWGGNLKFAKLSIPSGLTRPLECKYNFYNNYTGETVELTGNGNSTTVTNIDPTGKVRYRYNKVTVDNVLVKPTTFNWVRYIIKDDVWAGDLKKYEVFTSDTKRKQAQNLLGNAITIQSGKWNATTRFGYNDWTDWTDKENQVYTESNISEARSIKLKDEANTYDTDSDMELVENNPLSDAEIQEAAVSTIANIHIFDDDDPVYLLDDVYNAEGKYVLNSFTEYDYIFGYVPYFKYREVTDAVYEDAEEACQEALDAYNIADNLYADAQAALSNAQTALSEAQSELQVAIAELQAATEEQRPAAEARVQAAQAVVNSKTQEVAAANSSAQQMRQMRNTAQAEYNSANAEYERIDRLHRLRSAYGIKPNGQPFETAEDAAAYITGDINNNPSFDLDNNPLKENPSYNITRTVVTFPTPLFDFNWSSYQSDDDKATSFRELWNVWYPSYGCPIDMDNGQVEYSTYLDYDSIDINEGGKVTFTCSKPGVVLFGTSAEKRAIDAPNNSGIVPWKNAHTNYTMKVYHNHEDATSQYTMSTDIKPGSLGIAGVGDATNIYYALPTFFEKQKAGIPCSMANAISQSSVTGIAYSGSASCLATAKNNHCWAQYIGICAENGVLYRYNKVWTETVHPGSESSPGYVTYDFVADKEITLYSGVEKAIQKETLVSDTTDGICYNQPVWGHCAFKIAYKDYFTEQAIAQAAQEGKVFEVGRVADTDLPNSTCIWVDRDTTQHSADWFTLDASTITANEGSGKGNMLTELKSNSGAMLYYCPKLYKEGSGTNPKEIDDYNTAILYPPTCGINGNLTATDDKLIPSKLTWSLQSVKLPTSGSVTLDNIERRSSHKYYTDGLAGMQTAAVLIGSIDDYDFDNDIFPFTVTVDEQTLNGEFRALTQTGTIDAATSTHTDWVSIFGPGATVAEQIVIPISTTLHYRNCTARFAKSEVDNLVSYAEDKFNFANYSFNSVTQNVPGFETEVEQLNNYSYKITANKEIKCIVNAVLTDLLNNNLTFSFRGNEYTVNVTPLLEGGNFVSIMSTDIRRPDKTSIIGKIDASTEYQIVRQQWNSTVEVNNFWWIDDTHILELDNYNWTLKRKTSDLDDWNGDRWEKIWEISRTGIITSSVLRYIVTSSYNTAQNALLLVFSAFNDSKIRCDVYDPMNELQLKGSVYFQIRKHSIGEKLNDVAGSGTTANFNTYAVLSAAQLINQADWSSTITDGKLMIGCHHSNNYRQWTAIFDSNSLAFQKCIQGYGFVGLKGDLTGGQIPSKYFSKDVGFTATVFSIGSLGRINSDASNADEAYEVRSLSDINTIKDSIVGTAERQWYISKTITGIVSHLEYDSKTHTHIVRELPITNKFDAVYKSPSFFASMIGDTMICTFPFADAFKFPPGFDAVWQTMMVTCSYPIIFMFNPRAASLAYLQQTLGQYAYVHYNSSESMEKPEAENNAGKNGQEEGPSAKGPILSDDYTFDKQILKQDASVAKSVQRFMEALFAAFAPALQHIERTIAVNTEVNQTATSDTGKKYGQMALENLGGLAVAALTTESRDMGLTSQVVGMKSLDMFYSTSDKQKVYAGPGYVEHQFVADCIAQSVTDIETEGQVQQVVYTIKALTMLQLEITVMTQKAAADALEKSGVGLADVMICGTAAGGAIQAGLNIAASALRTAAVITEETTKQLDTVLDTICQRGVTSELAGVVSRHALTTEGKHKYGEKNEEFMWPCWGVPAGGVQYNDETVNACIKESNWAVTLMATKFWASLVPSVTLPISGIHIGETVKYSSMRQDAIGLRSVTWNLYGNVPYYQASCYGSSIKKQLPEDMACIQGVPLFLPTQAFKNENIGASDPAFAPSLFQDYIIDKSWELSQTCTYGLQQWVTVKDTKITSCPPSNMRVTSDFCGIATPYTAIEVKRGLSKQYMRPWAITPNTLAFNCTGYNSILDNNLYHSFDGLSYRIVEWTGTPGLMKNNQTFLYAFQVNDRFKRSNKFPANELQGAFNSEPIQAVDTLDKLWTQVTVAAKEQGMEGGTIGEDKDTTRWSIPIFTEPVTLLPAAVKTLTAMPLIVYDGITSLTTDIANNQTAYKAPLSVDFTIGKNVYRQTEEYICSVQTQEGLDIVTDLVPSLGLQFIGSTPTEAYFYSKATRCYYTFTGSTLVKMDMMERFRDIKSGNWDFVNQEVVMPCLMTFKRLNAEVEDKDTETDNIIVPVLSKNQVSGELIPPITTIFNDRSWYKVVSLPSGLAYQGPNRVVINRSVFTEYMTDSIKSNFGKWKKMDKEKYVTKRVYPETYDRVDTDVQGVKGWTHNPFLLVTSALGTGEEVDNLYEWEITFCWPIEMDLLYGVDNYAVVNITAETMTPGGKVKSRPTHVYLTKELFTRNGNYGYYSFRYQSKNGAGNRERLHIWSDQYIAISAITCECKQITGRRTEILTQQMDIQNLKEL